MSQPKPPLTNLIFKIVRELTSWRVKELGLQQQQTGAPNPATIFDKFTLRKGQKKTNEERVTLTIGYLFSWAVSRLLEHSLTLNNLDSKHEHNLETISFDNLKRWTKEEKYSLCINQEFFLAFSNFLLNSEAQL